MKGPNRVICVLHKIKPWEAETMTPFFLVGPLWAFTNPPHSS